MAPDDDILDGPGGGAEELRSIVARAGRHRRRSLVGIAAAVAVVGLAAGGGVGYALSDHSGRTQTVTAGGTPAAGAPSENGATGASAGGGASAAVGSNVAYGGGIIYTGGTGTLQHLFTRTAGAVTVRAYISAPAGTSTAACGVRSEVIADTSTPQIAGSALADLLAPTGGAPAVWLTSQRLGQAEGAPVDVVMVHTTGDVTKVVAQFTDGSGVTDQMVPVQGWSVLAATLPAALARSSGLSVATVRVYAASGQVTQLTETLDQVQPQPATCGCAEPALKAGGTTNVTALPSACLPCPVPSTGASPGSTGAAGSTGTASGGGSVLPTLPARTGTGSTARTTPLCFSQIFGGTARSGSLPTGTPAVP